ncbi:MAG: hypothetical protein LBB14_00465 [Puniceicoccales bacterium]|jgi:hypothetical protein|nr:hypothetical protein [Puniceicoccales bacterium]
MSTTALGFEQRLYWNPENREYRLRTAGAPKSSESFPFDRRLTPLINSMRRKNWPASDKDLYLLISSLLPGDMLLYYKSLEDIKELNRKLVDAAVKKGELPPPVAVLPNGKKIQLPCETDRRESPRSYLPLNTQSSTKPWKEIVEDDLIPEGCEQDSQGGQEMDDAMELAIRVANAAMAEKSRKFPSLPSDRASAQPAARFTARANERQFPAQNFQRRFRPEVPPKGRKGKCSKKSTRNAP